MIQVKKTKLDKKHLAIIITASVLVLLIVAYAIISTLITSGLIGDSGNTNSKNPPEILEGEAILNNRGIVYPYISSADIISIAVGSKDPEKDSFLMTRPIKDDGNYESYFAFFYNDRDGNSVAYYPPILSKDSNTEYTDFYSIENSDGLNAYKINYLCAAIGALYFDERINPEEDKDAQLARYGLDEDNRDTIIIQYVDSEGMQREHKVYVGDSLITGVGYYFMLEGRDYIYTSEASERFEYLLGDFESFLHSRVIAEGLPSDGIYEPFLTTDYKQWTNKYYGMDNGHKDEHVAPGSQVIVEADVISPIYLPDDKKTDGSNGYRHTGYTVDAIDLAYIDGQPQFERLIKALKSNTIGSYENNEIVVTVSTNANAAEFDKVYKYVIRSVESVLAEDKEYFESGYAVGSNNTLKVTYDYYIDGEQKNDEICHGIINISDMPEGIQSTLKNASVGENLDLEFEITYNEQTAIERTIQLFITEISIISKFTDTGAIKYPEKIDENCIVTYSYKYVVDGSSVLREGTDTVDLSAITEGEDLAIKNAIIGLKVGPGPENAVSEEKIYCQLFSDFATYSIRTIKGYVEKEMIVSFEYLNASQRDPFYGESIYKNTLENENKYYPLDATACERVTFLLGGVGPGYNSQVSAGLSGSETVAVGLTPYNMDKYHLYDGYTIYFELPRGVVSIPGSAQNEVPDYKHLSTLGFNLYISKENSDGSRYIGSDMYDIIVKIDGKGFEFLEKSFDEYWTRRNLIMVDLSIVDKMVVDFGMEDVYGKYTFDLNHQTIYIVGNEHLTEKPESGGTEYDFITVKLTSDGEISDSAYSDILSLDRDGVVTLETIYETVTGSATSVDHDTEATANFKNLLTLAYAIQYSGVLTEEEMADVKDMPKIMSISFTLDGEKNYGDIYTYDFYRVSDRRVMVDLYRVDSDGNRIDKSEDELSGFYISTLAAKKIINGVCSLLNGKTVDPDIAYWD